MDPSLDSKPFYLSFGLFIFLVLGTLSAAAYVNFTIKSWTKSSLIKTTESITAAAETKFNEYKISYYGLTYLLQKEFQNSPDNFLELFNSDQISSAFGPVNYVTYVDLSNTDNPEIFFPSIYETDNTSRILSHLQTAHFQQKLSESFSENKPIFLSNNEEFLSLIPISADSKIFIYVNIGMQNILSSVYKADLLNNIFALELKIFEQTDENKEVLVFSTSSDTEKQNVKKTGRNTLENIAFFDSLKLRFEFKEVRNLSDIKPVIQIPFIITLVGLLSSIASFGAVFLSLTNFKENYKRFITLNYRK